MNQITFREIEGEGGFSMFDNLVVDELLKVNFF